MQTYRVAIARLLKRLGDVPLDTIDSQRVAALVAELHADGLKKHTIRKTVSVLAMVLDHAGCRDNPARDKLTVKMPREEKRHVQPPTAEHVEAVLRLLPKRYVLPALVLDASGMRVGEVERLTWGDVDEPRRRWRVSAAVAKTGRPRWVEVHPGRRRTPGTPAVKERDPHAARGPRQGATARDGPTRSRGRRRRLPQRAAA